MNALSLFLLAIVTPLLLAVSVLLPSYAGIWGAAYAVYELSHQSHTLADRMLDVFYVADVYQRLFEYWLAHMTDASVVKFALPLLGLPVVGFATAFFATRWIVRRLRDLSHLTS